MGASRYFNGTSAKVTLPTAPLSITGALTLAAWIYPTALIDEPIISKRDSVYVNRSNYHLDIRASGKLYFLMNDNGTNRYWITGAVVLNANEWSHIAVKITNGTNAVFYVNGVVKACGNGGGTASIPTNDAVPMIGSFTSGSFFHGYMADVRIYNTALTAAEVMELAAGKSSVALKNLVGHYPMRDVGANPTIKDISGMGNNGTNADTTEAFIGPKLFL